MITVRFSERMPTPRLISVAMEGDNGAEDVRFILPELAESQVATLRITDPDGNADALPIVDGLCAIDQYTTDITGLARAYVEILAGTDQIWHSEILYMRIGELGLNDEEIEQEYPTALQYAISATGANVTAAQTAKTAAEAAQAAAEAAQQAAEIAVGAAAKYQIVENMAALASSVADRVLVMHDDSAWGTGGPCWFQKSGVWTTYGYTRADGSYMYPAPNQGRLQEANAPKEQLTNVMYTWVGNANLHHGTGFNNDLFSTHVAKDTDNLFEMDCSAFVCAILHGITYANSRYVLGEAADNVELPYMSDNMSGSKSTYMPKGGLQTSEMAMWYAQHGQLYELPTDVKKVSDTLQFGDILFGSNGTNRPHDYYGIEHVMFVLGTAGTYVAVAESTNVTGIFEQQNLKIAQINLSTTLGQYLKVFARPNYNRVTQTPPITLYQEGVYRYNAIMLPTAQIRRLTDDTGEIATSVPYGALYADSRSMATADYLPVIPQSTIQYTGLQSGARNSAYTVRCYEYDGAFALTKNTTIAYMSGSDYVREEHTLDSTTKYVRFSQYYLSSSSDTIRFNDAKDFEVTITPAAGT